MSAARSADPARSALPERRGSRPEWNHDGVNWPNRAASRFVRAAGLNWHIQEMGPGTGPVESATPQPTLLLIHGTGAATHSWRDVMPLLAAEARVVAIDLPGHGFTDNPGPRWLAIDAMSKSLVQLLDAIDVQPDVAVGHSAGAALLVRMALDGLIAPTGIISVNGALMPFGGIGRTLFPSLARLLFLNPLAPRVFAWQAGDRDRVATLLRGTGSDLTERQIDEYWTVMRYPDHISGALGMMANWDLEALVRDLPNLGCHLHLIAGSNDKTVPPTDADRIAVLYPLAELVRLEGLGHLAHEEAPDRIVALIHDTVQRWGVGADR